MEKNVKPGIIIGIIILAVLAAFVVEPVSQDPAYHDFADKRTILGIPNFWNVFSNAPISIAGAMGLVLVAWGRMPGGLSELKSVYIAFFIGMFLTGFGSGYYHLNPVNQTLVWDRLPMTILFMAIFSIFWGEHISLKAGRRMVWPLIIVGILSIGYWHVTESTGHGDLRPYGLVQFLPMLLIPVILLLYKSRFTSVAYLWGLIGFYAASKITEFFDSQIYTALGVMSGHSLKHLFAAAGGFMLYLALIKRKPA